MKISNYTLLFAVLITFTTACSNDDNDDGNPAKDPNTSEVMPVDRFSDDYAVLFKRSENSDLPAADAPINFDEAPFITQSLGPDGQVVRYYNFDVQPLEPAPIYILVNGTNDIPIEGQLNIIDVIPGDENYSDFWQMYIVRVSEDYVANSATSYSELLDLGFIAKQDAIVNCPVVPYGSTANENYHGHPNSLRRGWYKGKIVYYFSFEEKELNETAEELTPLSPIYVTFNINPDPNNPASGPASGLVRESDGVQTHNVIETIPTDADYSPFWAVYIYDNADFDNVSDLETAKASNILMENAMYVNCPVVYAAE